MNWTDEEFMELTNKNYPDFDWDSFNIDEFPDIWKIRLKVKERTLSLSDGKESFREMESEIDKEYPDEESVKEALDRIKANSTELLAYENKIIKVYMGPIVPGSEKILKTKPKDAQTKHFTKELRKLILDGTKVFPIALP
jgi:hypothetical protein